jgi:glycerophosphoryl diester phosphodiesterase
MPILREALALAAELDLGVNIEIKAGPGREYATAAAVAGAVNRLGPAPPVFVSSFQPAAIATVRDLAPKAARGALFRSVPAGWAEIAKRLDCVVIGADHRRLRRSRIAEIRASGYKVAAYTVNDPTRARLLFAWGVTSVFTDMPDMILRAGAADDSTRATPLAPPDAARLHQGAVQ